MLNNAMTRELIVSSGKAAVQASKPYVVQRLKIGGTVVGMALVYGLAIPVAGRALSLGIRITETTIDAVGFAANGAGNAVGNAYNTVSALFQKTPTIDDSNVVSLSFLNDGNDNAAAAI